MSATLTMLLLAMCGSSSHQAVQPELPRVRSQANVAAVVSSDDLILARGGLLRESRRRLRDGDPALCPAYTALMQAADSALRVGIISVMQKQKIPPSGDKHDFMSLAPYWWPDPSKPNGLPYIRRDGNVNPESRIDHDGTRFQAMENAVESLALAYYFTGDEKYAEHGTKLLRTWFVDPATRMNPNLRFAQAIPGVAEGRGTGIIDTRNIPQLVDAVRLLQGSRSLSASDDAAIVGWCRDYLNWLRTSKNGKDEGAAENNHGTWYDTQVAALALFVGDTALARQVIGTDVKKRLAAQIASDGSQSRELARTRPLHYSLFNLDAFTQLAEMGRHVGVNLWSQTTPSGASLRAALNFVAPYADSTVRWKKPEAMQLMPEVFALPFRRAAVALGDPAFTTVLSKLRSSAVRTDRALLLYPAAQPEHFTAAVDVRYTGANGASLAGVKQYRAISAALAAAPVRPSAPYVIFVRNGRYHEKLTVTRPMVHLVGENRDSTIVTYDAGAGQLAPGGGTYGTRGSFTLRIAAPDFQATNITIENAFDYAANAAKLAGDPAKVSGTQGVAIMTDSGSDRAVFSDCRISGYQDTLFANSGRQYFRNCAILGNVDFIFGAGQAVFDDCDIISRDRGSPTENGYITAPSTDVAKPYGFLFIDSRLLKDHATMAPASVALGRPWHPGGSPSAIGNAVFLDCWMDDHISAKGWDRMSSVDSASRTRFWFEPGSARLFEYYSTGPGAIASPTRRVLSDGDVRTYTIAHVLGDWTPERTLRTL